MRASPRTSEAAGRPLRRGHHPDARGLAILPPAALALAATLARRVPRPLVGALAHSPSPPAGLRDRHHRTGGLRPFAFLLVTLFHPTS